jgi:light-regulated signal transduction histidine kinase (bacteriophytochrome)
VGTGFDINDLREAQEKLTSYASKLEESNRDLEHFATIASHDLQEPLRKVLIFTDHLKKMEHASMSTEGLDDLERIQRATGKMQRLITDLLDLSRITRRGKAFQKVDLQASIKEVIAELSYGVKDIHSQVTLVGNGTVEADAAQIHQMLAQLLDNALKFHPIGKQSVVKIEIYPTKTDCRIMVTDDGVGIKPEHLSRIFNTFVRLHHGEKYAGTGIGLALVKKIVERHNGSITVESAPEKGSTFTVTLPVVQKLKI